MSSANATCCVKVDYQKTYLELRRAISDLMYNDLYKKKEQNINPIIALEINAQMKMLEYILDEIIPNSTIYEKE